MALTLSEAFKNAVDESPISKIELSWSFKMTQARLDELYHGAEYDNSEELQMLRFVFKHRQKNGGLGSPPLGTTSPEIL